MAFDYYVDIRVITSADMLDLSLAVIRNQVYAVLHGTFRALAVVDKSPYAIALIASAKLQAKQAVFEKKRGKPPRFDFDIFRVFSDSNDALQRLVDIINKHWTIRDYSVVGTPTAVPIAKITGWQSFRRFRIPTNKMERSKLSHDNMPLRERRLALAKDLPYLKVASKSTGQFFTLTIDVIDMDNAGEGLPDGYGLARASQPFALPVF